MYNLIPKYILSSLGTSLRFGDVSTLHKGSLVVTPRSSGKLKAALQQAIGDGNFLIKLKLLPDVDSFKITLGIFNPLLAAFGLRTRFGSAKQIRKGRNSRNNRYLLYMYNRLLKAQSNGALYWPIAMQLLNSSVYLIACLHHLDRNFYRNLSQERLVSLIKSVQSLLGTGSGGYKSAVTQAKFGKEKLPLYKTIKYHRAYLPKGPTKFRPLGVPTIAWRVYLAM